MKSATVVLLVIILFFVNIFLFSFETNNIKCQIYNYGEDFDMLYDIGTYEE